MSLKVSFVCIIVLLMSGRVFGRDIFDGISSPSSISSGSYIEPYVGYNYGSGDQGASEITYTGPVYGARFGYEKGLFFGALDLNTGSYSLETKVNNSTTELKYSSKTYGIVLGTKLIPFFDFAFKYTLKSILKVKEGSNIGLENHGSGYGAIISSRMLPFVTVNFEFSKLSFDKFEHKSQNPNSGDLSDKIESTEFLLSLSIPIHF